MGLFDWIMARPKPLPQVRLTVFCTEELLPCPLQIAHPDGILGSLLGVPRALHADPTSRLALETSMGPGAYTFRGESGAVTARVTKREPGESYPGRDDVPETAYRGLGTLEREWLNGSSWAVQLEISEVNGSETEAVLYLVEAADRFAALAAGLVLDEEAHRYFLPGAWKFYTGGAANVT